MRTRVSGSRYDISIYSIYDISCKAHAIEKEGIISKTA